ncbi:hypothetical protein CBS147332_8696 [Penicillium roqueforti]|nr:hypothetical protein CBS147332_8696 [Penicillium roqueforti]KAI3095852.1 hypothetical protein CBS147331_9405 [Penicillium roqueforti]
MVSLPHYFPESRKNKSGACCFDNSHPLLSLSRHFYSHPIIHPPHILRDPYTAISSHFTIQMDIDPARRNKKPRLLLETEREKLDEFVDSIHYSARYNDDKFEYRHVQLPKNMLKKIPADYFDSSKGTLKLLWEEEWRALGITQSLGWEHYEVHEPEPHILLFKRPLNYQPPLQQ